MKKFLIITGCIITGVVMLSCNRTRRGTGRAYMPDMVYSVAYETYAPAQERLDKYGAHYNNRPVEGTIARGDMFPYTLKNDSAGIAQATSVVNPLPPLSETEKQEASRLYLVNCAICHGSKLNGNGPLYNDGNGPFGVKPADLMASKMTEGSMFHVAAYGKGQMGSYASQLSPKQRWMIISYIKEKQKTAGGPTSAAVPDSMNAKKPAIDTAGTAKKK